MEKYVFCIFFYFIEIRYKYKLYVIFSSDGTATTSFPETPLFSTYLVAFAVSNLAFKANTNRLNVLRQRVFAQPSLIESTALAVEDGERLLNAISDYVQVDYSLPKMDQIAVPGYGPGGIENWGKKSARNNRYET